MTKPLRSSDNRTSSDYEAYLLARIDALEMRVRELTAALVETQTAASEAIRKSSPDYDPCSDLIDNLIKKGLA